MQDGWWELYKNDWFLLEFQIEESANGFHLWMFGYLGEIEDSPYELTSEQDALAYAKELITNKLRESDLDFFLWSQTNQLDVYPAQS